MIVRCESCGDAWQDGTACGMCWETLVGVRRDDVIDEGCEHRTNAGACEACAFDDYFEEAS